MITVTNLKKTYPGKVPTPALKGLTFSIAKGEFVSLTGRSGSGKSTLLHQLGLLDTPTVGTITIADIDTSTLSDNEKTAFRLNSLGYVFQEYALVAEFTALENVLLPAMALGNYNEKHKKRARELLSVVGLSDRLDYYPNELSGGQQQRVAIARALINHPEILFADEPTANLDTASAKAVLDIFGKLNKEEKLTIIMVTHEPEYAKLAQRIIELLDGEIIKDTKLTSKKNK
jgi:putative ABC transport system ATP-binding protein